LQGDLRQLLERFEVWTWPRKVVGVGSVGTRVFIVLLQGRDEAHRWPSSSEAHGACREHDRRGRVRFATARL
jgi:hypothetical protein